MKKTLSIILTAVLLLTFAAFALGSSSSEETTVEKNQTQETDSAQQKEETTEDPAKTEKQRTEVRIGDTLNADGLKITFDSAEKWTSDNQFIQPDEGNIYIRLHISIVNETDSDKVFYGFDCYADGEKCDDPYVGDDRLSFESVSSGRKTSGYVYFEIPANAAEIEAEYEISLFGDKKAYFIVEL